MVSFIRLFFKAFKTILFVKCVFTPTFELLSSIICRVYFNFLSGLFDLLITKKNYKAFIEVKNVTLSRKPKIAEFPDSVTSRGAKHIEELIKGSKKGYEVYIAFIIQREDCNQFAIASDIDPEYSEILSKAVKKKLNILCYDCKFSSKGIKINKKIKFKI